MSARPVELPSLDDLGRDLLQVSATRKLISLAAPFTLAAAFFWLTAHAAATAPRRRAGSSPVGLGPP